MAHRSRRRAVHPPHLARAGGPCPRPFERSLTTSCCRSRARWRTSRLGLADRHPPATMATIIGPPRSVAAGDGARSGSRRPAQPRNGGYPGVGSTPRGRTSRRLSVPTRREPQSVRHHPAHPGRRGERLNAGVILLCRPRRYLGAHIRLDEARLAAFAPGWLQRPSILTSRRSRHRRWRAVRRADRPAGLSGAVPLARRPGQDDHPAIGRPHRPDRRSGRRARAPVRIARGPSPRR